MLVYDLLCIKAMNYNLCVVKVYDTLFDKKVYDTVVGFQRHQIGSRTTLASWKPRRLHWIAQTAFTNRLHGTGFVQEIRNWSSLLKIVFK